MDRKILVFHIIQLISRSLLVSTCSHKYLIESMNDKTMLEKHVQDVRKLAYSAPWNVKYLINEHEKEFVISYSYKKRSPIWAYQELKRKSLTSTKKTRIEDDSRISSTFQPDLNDIKKLAKEKRSNQYKLIPLIPYENHKDTAGYLFRHTNHVLVKLTNHKQKIWDQLNTHVQNLVKNRSISDVRVCTGTLYRSEQTKKNHVELQSKHGFYKPTALAAGEKCDEADDRMNYEIRHGVAVPDALFKVILFTLDKKRILSTFVVPTDDFKSKNGPLHTYYWSSLLELERIAGLHIFYEELRRLKPSARNFIEKACQAACDVTIKDNVISSPSVKVEQHRLRFAEHSIQEFENYIVNFNHKNLVSDWVIEHMDRIRFSKPSAITRKNDGKNYFSQGILKAALPFDITDECYGKSKEIQEEKKKNSKIMYDRGHLAAANYHKDTDQNYKNTFLLLNAAPQASSFNQRKWKVVEELIQKQYEKGPYDDMFIMTGPLYIAKGNKMSYPLISKSQLAVGTHWFKVAIFANKRRGIFDAVQIVMENKQYEGPEVIYDDQCITMPKNELERHAGFKIFPHFVSHEKVVKYDYCFPDHGPNRYMGKVVRRTFQYSSSCVTRYITSKCSTIIDAVSHKVTKPRSNRG